MVSIAKVLAALIVLAAAVALGYRAGERGKQAQAPLPRTTTAERSQSPAVAPAANAASSGAKDQIRKLSHHRDNPLAIARLLQLAEIINVAEIPALLRELESSGSLAELNPILTRLA